MIKPNKINIHLTVAIFKENEKFMSYCQTLDIIASGKNIKESQKKFHQALNLWIKTAIKNDALEKVLNDLGWKITFKEIIPPEKYEKNKFSNFVKTFSENLNIPLYQQCI